MSECAAADELRSIQERERQRHRADVAYILENHPEIGQWLTEFTKEFGECDYRMTMREVK